MPNRSLSGIFLLLLVAFSFVGCSKDDHAILSMAVTPQAVNMTQLGQTQQLTAKAQLDHVAGLQDVTNSSGWTSSNPRVAKVDASGLVTAVGSGSATITAASRGASAASTVSVSPSSSGSGGGTGLRDLTAITIIPATQPTGVVGEPVQFLAIGSFTSSPVTQDVTTHVKWVSSDVSVATIDSAGLAIVVGAGGTTTTITAIGTTSTGALITATATLTACVSTCGPVTLPQLAVYEVGLGHGLVQGGDLSLNATAIDCDPFNGKTPACTGNFTLGATVTLTATAAPGSRFDGWSGNVTPVPGVPTQCTITMNNNEPVGAIFDLVPVP
jgi:hypothetical protein